MATDDDNDDRPRRTCYRHPKREATLFCRQCERPACHDCVHNTLVGLKCSDCAPAQLTRRPARVGVQLAVVVLVCIAVVAAVSKFGGPGPRGAGAEPQPGFDRSEAARFSAELERCAEGRADEISDDELRAEVRRHQAELPPEFHTVNDETREPLQHQVAAMQCAEEITPGR